MTRRDYITALALYGGALALLTGLITGHAPTALIGTTTFITALLALDESTKK